MPRIKKKRRFGRTRDQRKALFNALACHLVLKEKIETTEAKAKELRSFVEKLVTKSKEDNISTHRLLEKRLSSKEAVRKLIKEIGPRYKERPGGYTRILKLGPRKEDGARLAIIEFV